MIFHCGICRICLDSHRTGTAGLTRHMVIDMTGRTRTVVLPEIKHVSGARIEHWTVCYTCTKEGTHNHSTTWSCYWYVRSTILLLHAATSTQTNSCVSFFIPTLNHNHHTPQQHITTPSINHPYANPCQPPAQTPTTSSWPHHPWKRAESEPHQRLRRTAKRKPSMTRRKQPWDKGKQGKGKSCCLIIDF